MKYPQQVVSRALQFRFCYSIRIQSQGTPIRVHLFEFYCFLVATNGTRAVEMDFRKRWDSNQKPWDLDASPRIIVIIVS